MSLQPAVCAQVSSASTNWVAYSFDVASSALNAAFTSRTRFCWPVNRASSRTKCRVTHDENNTQHCRTLQPPPHHLSHSSDLANLHQTNLRHSELSPVARPAGKPNGNNLSHLTATMYETQLGSLFASARRSHSPAASPSSSSVSQ